MISIIILISKRYPNIPGREEFFHWIWHHPRVQRVVGMVVSSKTVVSGPVNQKVRVTCPRQTNPDHPTFRVSITDIDVVIFAWPSKGGVIIHDHADAVDLKFLGLDPLNPPDKRLLKQSEEDDFCQRLLLLGAKWWDSKARYRYVRSVDDMDSRAIDALENETEPIPTMKERRWVSVAWPTTGGLWVAEFDTTMWGIEEEDNLLPDQIAKLRLARTMDERCQVLRDHFRSTFYNDVREYKGYAFLNSWDGKETGELGPLKPLVPLV